MRIPYAPVMFVGAILTVMLLLLKAIGAFSTSWDICWLPLLIALLIVSLLGYPRP